MPLMHDQIDDFVNLTLDRFKRKTWTDISLDNQHHIFASKMFENKGKDPEKGGTQLTYKVQFQNTGTAKHSELFAVDATAVKNLTISASVPWSKQTVNFSYDIDEELFQSDMETIVEELKVREHSMYNDFFELMEEALWSSPASSTTSPRPPSGVPYWVVKNSSSTGSFGGGNPTGHTAGAGGIDASTYTRWKNWSVTYTAVSRDDLVTKMRKACAFCKFQAPRPYAQTGGELSQSAWGFYTTWPVLENLEKVVESRNDNLGVDLGKYAGSVVLMGNPISWVPYLTTNDTSNPVYGLNWKKFRYFFKRGRHMLRHPPQQAAHQHTVREVHMDNWGNFACYDRRANFVAYVA